MNKYTYIIHKENLQKKTSEVIGTTNNFNYAIDYCNSRNKLCGDTYKYTIFPAFNLDEKLKGS